MKPQTSIQIFASHPHACAYLPGRQAITAFIDPDAELTMALYSRLAEQGFRRSGDHIYRPACADCAACIPVRIPANRFSHSRRERRIWRRNQDIEITRLSPEYRQTHFDLYQRYLGHRHAGGGMDHPEPQDFVAFMSCAWSKTDFFEFSLQGEVVAVAVTDQLDNGLSAVYTFFDPKLANRSLGAFTILWQIEECRRQGLEWLYLGYWIEECGKMAYKGDFRPLQAHRRNIWQDL